VTVSPAGIVTVIPAGIITVQPPGIVPGKGETGVGDHRFCMFQFPLAIGVYTHGVDEVEVVVVLVVLEMVEVVLVVVAPEETRKLMK
jgi:hypothetical protein